MASETSEDTASAYCYPRKDLYADWKEEADEMGMTISEYIQAMVEAGRKKFDGDGIQPDEEAAELREQRNHYKHKLKEARERNEKLEERLSTGERAAIREFVNDNPGASFKEIVNHLGETVPDRAGDLLEMMEGEEIARDGDGYYPTGGYRDE